MKKVKDQFKKNQKESLSFLCFGGLDWWYQHRSHVDFQITRKFSAKGNALYVNSIVMQIPNFSEGKKLWNRVVRKSKSIFTGLKKSDVGFWVYSPFSLPVHHIPFAKEVNDLIVAVQIKLVASTITLKNPIIMVVCPAACDIALKCTGSHLVYLRTDAYELFPNVDKEVITNYDLTLKNKADLTLFVSDKLYQDEKHQCNKAIFLDHGVDFEMFDEIDKSMELIPLDIKELMDGRPIVGFFGTLDSHTVDVDMCAQVASKLPEMNFVFVGKVAADYDVLISKDNIYILGVKSYEQVPYYGHHFDVAIMPWQQTDWIEACNPIKLKEYLALGKPIVSTPFQELKEYSDVVYAASGADEFAKQIKTALAEDSEALIMKRKNRVRSLSWESRVEMIIENLRFNE